VRLVVCCFSKEIVVALRNKMGVGFAFLYKKMHLKDNFFFISEFGRTMGIPSNKRRETQQEKSKEHK
jgi:hypothetical protein